MLLSREVTHRVARQEASKGNMVATMEGLMETGFLQLAVLFFKVAKPYT